MHRRAIREKEGRKMWITRKYIAECIDLVKKKTIFEKIVEGFNRQEAETKAAVSCKRAAENPDSVKVTVT